MIQPPNSNVPANRRGFARNGMPKGFGQQRGHSPWLDSPQPDPMDVSVDSLLASAPGLAQPQQAPQQDEEPDFMEALTRQSSQGPAPDMGRIAGAPRNTTMPVGRGPVGAILSGGPAPSASWQDRGTRQGITTSQAYEGFDTAREQNRGKSAKDSFLAASEEAAAAGHRAPAFSGDPNAHKAALADWAINYIRPKMIADGHDVYSVAGDKLNFRNWQGDFEVDYARGAGAPDSALAWQATDLNAPPEAPAAPSEADRRQAIARTFLGEGNGELLDDDLDALLASLLDQQRQERI